MDFPERVEFKYILDVSVVLGPGAGILAPEKVDRIEPVMIAPKLADLVLGTVHGERSRGLPQVADVWGVQRFWDHLELLGDERVSERLRWVKSSGGLYLEEALEGDRDLLFTGLQLGITRSMRPRIGNTASQVLTEEAILAYLSGRPVVCLEASVPVLLRLLEEAGLRIAEAKKLPKELAGLMQGWFDRWHAMKESDSGIRAALKVLKPLFDYGIWLVFIDRSPEEMMIAAQTKLLLDTFWAAAVDP